MTSSTPALISCVTSQRSGDVSRLRGRPTAAVGSSFTCHTHPTLSRQTSEGDFSRLFKFPAGHEG